MIVGFTNNAGPMELVSAQELPLSQDLAGFTASIVMDGNQYPLFPVFTVATQFGAVVDAATPAGVGELVVNYNGQQSPGFQVTVVDSQPGFFTVMQNGQGTGIFTRSDFSLITRGNPARPGDVVIAALFCLDVSLMRDGSVHHTVAQGPESVVRSNGIE